MRFAECKMKGEQFMKEGQYTAAKHEYQTALKVRVLSLWCPGVYHISQSSAARIRLAN